MQPKQPKAEREETLTLTLESLRGEVARHVEDKERYRARIIELEQEVKDWTNHAAVAVSEANKARSALAGIPNPEAVRELIRWAKIWNVTLETDEAHWEAEFQMSEALAALTAPSASPQQK